MERADLSADFNGVSHLWLATGFRELSLCFPPSTFRHCRTFTQTPAVSGLAFKVETNTEHPGIETRLIRDFVPIHGNQQEDKSLSLPPLSSVNVFLPQYKKE